MGRKLGQHFLINKSAIAKIIAALDLSPYGGSPEGREKNDTIVEIGPGSGALTLPLVRKCSEIDVRCKVIAIEKDPSLVNWLLSKLVTWKGVIEIVMGDALKLLPNLTNKATNQQSNWKIVGNIPYYITGKLLRILGELEQKPETIVLTIQKEVAERIIAHPPKMNPTHRKCPMCGMNLLAAAVQIWAKAEIIGRLKPKDFSPSPKVDSAIIKLVPKPHTLNPTPYYKLIKLVFKQPRKTVLNNLSTGLGMPKEKVLEILKKFGLDGTERPQNLSLSQLLQMSLELQ